VLVDLIQTVTRDGIRLDGAYQAAAGSPPVAVDAICFLHGTGGNFYSSTLFDALAEKLLELGVGVLRANTRGHDLVCNAHTTGGGRRLGAAYEVVDDCRHDLAAWLYWLREHAGSRVGVIGHSSGAVKGLYALAREPALAATCLIALSPPRLSHSWFSVSPQGPEFLDTYRQAESHVRAGRPEALMEVRLPLPFVSTAAGYVEKYSPQEKYNYLTFISDVRCPILLTLGGAEVANNMAFVGAAEALQELADRKPALRVEVIPGADHFYSGVREPLGVLVQGWLKGLPPQG
jgi:alpha-beta hydrolase superfamily lysophospholipase